MAKESTIVVRNIARPMSLGWAKTVNGEEKKKFKKNESFTIPTKIVRGKDKDGKPIEIDALELLRKMYPGEIATDEGVVGKDEYLEMQKRIAELEAENAKLKSGSNKSGSGKSKKADKGEKADKDESKPESDANASGDAEK